MSPEYALDGFFSEKSDVFSFGVVVLEIISGKRNTGFYQSDRTLSLLGHVSALNFSFALIFWTFYIYAMKPLYVQTFPGMETVEGRQGVGVDGPDTKSNMQHK